MAAMDRENTIWIKQEEVDDMPDDPHSMSVEDPMGLSCTTDFIKQEPEVILKVDDTETVFVEDPLGNSYPTDYINQEPEVILKVNDAENIVALSTGSESDSSRWIQHSSESCNISSEETVKQEVVPSKLEIGAGKPMSFTVFGIHTQQPEEKEDGLFGIRLKCSLREKEFQTFSCSFCLQNFLSKYKLIMHVFIHIDGVQPPKYVCKSCGEVFCTNISLNTHMKMNAGVQAPFDGYNYKFGHIYNHENIVEVDQEVSFMENTENQLSNKETRGILRKFSNNNYKTQNMTSDAEKQDTHINYRISSITDNVNHRTLTHTYKCDVCGKAFALLEHLKTHGLTHAVFSSHTCNTCGKSFKLLASLKRHSLIHSDSNPHKCDICEKSFIQLSHLKAHYLIHTGSKPHECGICGKSFRHLSDLKKHSLIHIGSKPYKCDTCGTSFKRSGYLKKHSVIHTGSKPYKCDICDKSFTALGNLKNHSVIHTGLRPHSCDICGKSFPWLRDLKKHSSIHTGTKPHNCNICGKSFTRLDVLKQHLLRHTGLEPHKCDICGKSFKALDDLKKHCFRHTGLKLHKCDICGNSFTTLCHLKRHSAIHCGKTT